jgi:hypothetical protein
LGGDAVGEGGEFVTGGGNGGGVGVIWGDGDSEFVGGVLGSGAGDGTAGGTFVELLGGGGLLFTGGGGCWAPIGCGQEHESMSAG